MALALGAGCSGAQTAPDEVPSAPAVTPTSTTTFGADKRAAECPISREALGQQTSSRQFAGEKILFRSEAEASTFDELPGERKRVAAGRQSLGRRGVANENCLVTLRPLPIDAVVIRVENVSLGFKTDGHRTQFNALPEEVRIDLLAPYLVRASGIINTRCPVTDELLHPGCPSLVRDDIRIGFVDQVAIETFENNTTNRRNEIMAAIVLPTRGVLNTTCPISDQPLRLDSPVFRVNGTLIGVRNISTARTFSRMSPEEQSRLLPADSQIK